MLMVDDVTFIPAGGNSTLELKGYNVYRNGVCVTSQPVDALVYSDSPSAVGRYTYHVTAVYDRGESVPAGPVEVETDRVGLGSVRHTTIDIAVCEGEIVIAGADGVAVDVYSTDGRHVAAPSAAPEVRVRVPHGVYLV